MARLLSDTLADTTLPEATLAELERLNEAAAPLHIWLRTRANQPLQRPWHEAAEEPVPAPAPPGVASPRSGPLRVLPHVWKWAEIEPYPVVSRESVSTMKNCQPTPCKGT